MSTLRQGTLAVLLVATGVLALAGIAQLPSSTTGSAQAHDDGQRVKHPTI